MSIVLQADKHIHKLPRSYVTGNGVQCSNAYNAGGNRSPCSPCGTSLVTATPGATSEAACVTQPGYG